MMEASGVEGVWVQEVSGIVAELGGVGSGLGAVVLKIMEK